MSAAFDSAGEFWFVGTAIVPHSTGPGNITTVHIDRPRRFLIVQTPYGLIPVEPVSHYPYALVTFIGQWTRGK